VEHVAPPRWRLSYPSGVLERLGLASAYLNPRVMQPFVASMEVAGVPLGSGQPNGASSGLLAVAPPVHRSSGVPTDGQQVSSPLLCWFVSLCE